MKRILWGVAALLAANVAAAGQGPIAYWSFDETSGERVYDQVGAAHGLIQHRGQSTRFEIGDGPIAIKGAVRFSEHDGIFLGKPETLSLHRNDFTIVGRFIAERTENDIYRAILSYGRPHRGGFGVFIYRSDHSQAGKLLFTVRGPDDGDVSLTSDRRVDDRRPHDFACVVRDQVMTLWVDGQQQGEPVPYAGKTNATPPEYAQMFVAHRLSGIMDDLAVFDRALDESELEVVRRRGLEAVGYVPRDEPVQLQPCANGSRVTQHEEHAKRSEHHGHGG